ncbi:MAG: chemotaxis protein CheW [Gemmatimonadales bacterium]|nr:chemotaxis protein CheW [Gemmatimonadales bacterium]MBA3553721.1 chemotaxis protein CheW [Gemmatimonadales bacterium]
MRRDDGVFRELIDDYLVECLPLAERVADGFVELERRRREGASEDGLLASLQGMLHTVKGNSAMMGLAPAQELAHALEDLSALLGRDGAPESEGGGAALLVAGGGLLVEQVRAAAEGGDPGRTAEFVAQVHAFAAGTSEPPVPLGRRGGERRSAPDTRPEGAANVVRVDFRRLDAMLEVLGEGLIEHSAVVEAFRRVARHGGAGEEIGDLDRAIVAMEKTMKRLEAAVMETRLLQISTVFGRFPRQLRDIAHFQRKRVRLVISGGETSLDKAVLDRLGEPLLHLLSNAVVHGIEDPGERLRAGKPEEGTLELSAASRSGRVIIRLTDDGRGLDETKILAKAESLGLDVRSADPDRIRALIFLPGFSTADQVSQLAGRGVGLDVVAGSIRGLGGTIEVESRPGRGVTFVLDLPLTLAVVRSLIVEVDRERYAVPISQVAETVRAEPEAMRQINGRAVTLWRGDLIHVSDGGSLLGTGGRPAAARRFFVVISSGGRRRGVLVDRLMGHQDVVVKGLDRTLGRPEMVSGTTILGDGRVACILDAARILEREVPA